MRKCIFFLAAFFIFITYFADASDYDGHWAQTQIMSAINNGLAAGNENGDFEPDRYITRAEFVTLLINFTGLSSDSIITSFNDIDHDSWYFEPVAQAQALSIASGFDDGGFHPDEPVTREEAAVFICRAYHIEPETKNFPVSFTDADDISPYAKKYFGFAVANKIISGYEDNTLKPKNYMTRAEAVVLLEKALQMSSEFDIMPEFIQGYPKISPRGSVNNITLEIRTNVPCTVYYKAVKKTTSSSYLYPKAEEINQFLAQLPANKTVTSNIPLDSYNEEYNIFLTAVSDQGSKSRTVRLKDVKALAYSEGDGSADDPYLIYDENQLDYIRYCQNKHFKLANDIYLTKEWTPIDASDGYFALLDGDGHSINNLKITESRDNAGLFSELNGGIIKNLTISGEINADRNAGLFAGKSQDSIISNCAATGSVTAAYANAGGITGINNGIIENSVSAPDLVKSVTNAGGITGSGRGSIANCLSAAKSVVSDIYAGAVSGVNNGGSIKNCLAANLSVIDTITYNTGRITTNKENGLCENNYAYDKMATDSINASSAADNMNGLDISWDMINSKSFYTDVLLWDFNGLWKMQDKTEDTFILPLPKVFSDLKLSQGSAPYAPIKIDSAGDLKSINPELHYLMTCDILFDSKWNAPEKDERFNGSFDGGGHFISGITLSGRGGYTSLFGMIYDGTVRNLEIKDIKAEGQGTTAAVACENYGVIENVKISGSIKITESLSSDTCGGIAAVNYGKIEDCDARLDFDIISTSATIGGIAGHNEGFLDNNAYSGKMSVTSDSYSAASAAGGIVGFNNEGYIYNSFADLSLNSYSCTIYAGGIAGILNSGEIYKASSKGMIKTTAKQDSLSSSYVGGITGLSESGLVFNCFSAADINTKAQKSYCGGISGFNSSANIQNTYAVNRLTQAGGSTTDLENAVSAGGIAGFNEQGFISSNASINPWILSNGIIKGIADSASPEYLSGNFSVQKAAEGEEGPENGDYIAPKKINNEFFFLPVYMNGKLGWPSVKYESDGAVWTSSKTPNNLYRFPVLNGVKKQSEFITPTELR